MADVAVAIRSILLADTDITSLVGQRIYADRLPQGATIPAVEVTWLYDVPWMLLGDISRLTKARVQLNCIAATRAAARAIAKTIRTSGLAATKGYFSSVWIRGVAVESSFDADIESSDGTDDQRKQTSVDLQVDYSEI